ncbi:MAG: hypothetical protein RBQ97_10460 [Acholeplasma sp.]|nr:hypothetical protein [Acholeplasma sp.]
MTKKAKASVGRPTIMTDLTLQKLKEAFAFGCTDEEACYYAEIGKSTLYNYQKENPEFMEQKEALKQRPILLARQEVIKGLEGNPELALKFLERKKKDEFSLRSEITGKDGKDIAEINPDDPKTLKTLLKIAQAISENDATDDTAQSEAKEISKTTD